ncbi:HNH endonuclease [Mycolicibacterium sp. CBMA 234]|uniref:HNH endonuclease n=1 Tax=Mycolicibacterium sp. CBMA 234 TaxID=1918495 RepID=UPI0012DEDE5E|nr:HNH endonuclease [Mycolicibacterium sp. CBMA 234]
MPARSRAAVYARRRKRRMAKVDHDLTTEQWAALQQIWGGCAYCEADDADLQKDCVQPISRGGRYTLDNVVPACRSCNASKCNFEVTGWLRRKKLDEGRFLLRKATITRELASYATCPDEPV